VPVEESAVVAGFVAVQAVAGFAALPAVAGFAALPAVAGFGVPMQHACHNVHRNVHCFLILLHNIHRN